MADPFSGFSANPTHPAIHAANVVPSDSTDLATVPRALLIGVAGDLAIITKGGETLTIPVPVGLLPLSVTRVKSTGTTADDIVALW